MYFIPETPLEADVWWRAQSLPIGLVPDETIQISLSPTPVAVAFDGNLQSSQLATHIIRSRTRPEWGDNYLPGEPGYLFPCTVVECPPGSEHFYAILWAHRCGAGFLNDHVRAYAQRVPPVRDATIPLFEGWI